jgi:hypothetical protein
MGFSRNRGNALAVTQKQAALGVTLRRLRDL